MEERVEDPKVNSRREKAVLSTSFWCFDPGAADR